MKEEDRENLNFVIGESCVLEEIGQQKPLRPFALETLQFLDGWGSHCRQSQRRRSARKESVFTDVFAFAFWCRKNHLEKEKERYGKELEERLGVGVTLHFAASNVPTLFAYSLAAALLAGNCVLLRLPSKDSEQENILCSALEETLLDFPQWRKRVVLFRSAHSLKINEELSQLCQLRLIWGGDETIQEIRQAHLPVRARELPFVDRSSAAILSAKKVLAFRKEELEQVARNFYNDCYLNDQNACSSPRMLYWLGQEEEVILARKRFWNAVWAKAKESYSLAQQQAVQKLEQAYWIAANWKDVKLEFYENFAVCVWFPSFPKECESLSIPGGFFLESGGEKLEDFFSILTQKCQTLTCLGLEPRFVRAKLIEQRIFGVDRIVPFGHALDFSLIWDGRDLIREMSRRISCE